MLNLLVKFRTQPAKIKLLILALILIISVPSFTLAYIFIAPPQIIRTSPDSNSQDNPVDQSIKIRFNKPISRQAIEMKIVPDIQGQWSWQQGITSKHLFYVLVFQPEVILSPDKTYTIRLENVRGAVGNKAARNFQFSFTTQSVPGITQVLPSNEAKDILPEAELRIELSESNNSLAEFEFSLEPETELETKLSKDKRFYLVKPTSPLKQGITYQLIINRSIVVSNLREREVILRSEPEEVWRSSFSTIPAPGISSFSPTGSAVYIDSQIKIVFNKILNQKEIEANFVTSPQIEGRFSWQDAKTLIYKPSANLSYETKYTVMIKAGPRDDQGGFIEQDIINSFTTIGHVRVSRFSPANGASGVSTSTKISITFDQEVDHSSAEAHFSLNPVISGTFSWKGNTMTFHPQAELARDTKYTINLTPEIKSIFGLDSNRNFSSSFITQQSYLKLAVPVYHQKYALSCEVATLRMVLAYKGVAVSEDEMLEILGVSQPISWQANIWGDPYEAFVGSITGRQMSSGYGTYWGPLARVGNHYRPSQAFSSWGIGQITNEILAGNPVIVWGLYGGGKRYEWQTSSGRTVIGYAGEHTRVVVGFIGSPSNPAQIILNDPLAGQVTWSLGKFLSNWSVFGNSGVVVR